MTRLSDEIEAFLLEALEQQSQIELRRSLLAERFSCSPSQINYVLATRFSLAQGYHVESRRGGGGFVRLVRVSRTHAQVLQEVVSRIGDEMKEEQADELLHTLYRSGMLPGQAARMMLAAVKSEVLGKESTAAAQRAAILKSMLLCAAKEAEQNAL